MFQMLDDLIKNVQFVEKMAESINKAKLVAEPQRVRVEEYSNGVTKKVPSSLVQNLNTPELTQPCSSVEKQSSAVPSHATVLDSNTDEVSNVLHIQVRKSSCLLLHQEVPECGGFLVISPRGIL